MNTWDTRWLEKMESNGIKIKTGVRYMDDIRILLYALRAGWRWWEGSLCYCEVWRLEDESTGTSSTIRTARILVDIMNSMMSFLNFTMEVGDDFEDGKLPTLDLKIWVQAGVVDYEFYEKPMSGNTVVHAKTALSEQVKFSSLTQEVVRRLLHTSRRLPDDVMLECLEKLCQKMANSEHRPVYIKKVMISGITTYEAKLKKSLLPAGNPGFKPLHLGTSYNSKGRWRKKVMAREEWYKDQEKTEEGPRYGGKGGKKKPSQKDGKIQTSTVMFIPSTRGGMLTKMMREREQELSKITKFRVKMQEAGGIQLARLFSTDLARGESCGREDCHPCNSNVKRPNCKQSSILYESKCSLCNPAKQATSSLQEQADHQLVDMGARYPIKNSPNSRAPGQPSSKMEEKRVGIYYRESS
jgi:hypothetical protein